MLCYPEASTGLLPVEGNTQNLPFKIIGVDYAGPLQRGGGERVCVQKLRCTYYYLHAVLP